MEVQLQPSHEAFIEQRVRDGRFATTDDALREAISLLEERERQNPATRNPGKRTFARVFAESPFRGLDVEFPRDNDPLRPVDL